MKVTAAPIISDSTQISTATFISSSTVARTVVAAMDDVYVYVYWSEHEAFAIEFTD
jgi:hypothetical protein